MTNNFYNCSCGLTGGCEKCNPILLKKDSFIGILTDDEAREMKERINLFKKRFNDDLARRNKELFPPVGEDDGSQQH